MLREIVLNFLGWVSFTLFLVMQLPQIYFLIKTKRVEGVVISTWIMYAVALAMSTIYIYEFNEVKPWPAILSQGISGLLSILQVILYYRYRKN